MPLDRTRRLKSQPVAMERAEDISLLFDALAVLPAARTRVARGAPVEVLVLRAPSGS